jgi:hypothetical protein
MAAGAPWVRRGGTAGRAALVGALLGLALTACAGHPAGRPTVASGPAPEPPGAAAAAERIVAETAAAQEGVADFARYFAEGVVIEDAWGLGPVRGRGQLVQRLAALRGSTFEELAVEAVYVDPAGAALVERVAGLDGVVLEVRRYGPGGVLASWLLHPLEPLDPSVRRAVQQATSSDVSDPPLRAWGDGDGTIAGLLDDQECPGLAIVLIEPHRGDRAVQRQFRTIENLRRCGRDRQAGWWDELDEPPAMDAITGHVWMGPSRVALRGGSAAIDGLLRWAAGRFALGRLPRPPLASVTVASATRRCEGIGGRVERAGEDGGADLLLCFDGDVCADATCERYRWAARMTVLHELAHVWEAAHLDPVERDRYLEVTGLESWLSAEVPWHERGGERAAEVVAWGLLDREVPLVRLGSPPCERLRDEYHLLTGQEPTWGACSSADGG